MAYSQQDLSPYSSHILAKHTTAIQDLDATVHSISILALNVIREYAERPRVVTNNVKVPGSISSYEIIAPWQTPPGPLSTACVYTEERPVTWLSSAAGKDKIHHLLIVTAAPDGLLLITTTDADHRAVLLDHLQRGYFAPWELIPQAVLVKAMIENYEMRTLWLSGVHRNTTIKPSSKILSGYDLRDAIDPMSDSSYLAGAVRSTEGGVSLRNSSVWTGPNVTIQAFEARTVKLLAAVRTAIKAAPPGDLPVHSGLARWVETINDAKGCYFISHADPDTFDSESVKRRAQDLVDGFMVELGKSVAPAGKQVWAFAAKVTDLASQAIAVIDVTPELVDGRVTYRISPLPPAPHDEWAAAVRASSALLRAYYDSGHTIVGGALSHVRIQDSPFGGFKYGNFTKYCVTKENPQWVKGVQAPIQDMMLDADDSLFKWIFKEGLTLLGLKQPAPGECWLYCDDGSSEVADFVHLDIHSRPKRMTLFHAKGATSKNATRRAVPSPYEVVSAQAIKNLRAFDSKNLLIRISDRLKKKGAQRIWDHPWQVNLQPMQHTNTFEAALKQLGTNFDCEVIIVQPHVRRTDFEPQNGKQSSTVGARQLRTLLFGVESSARAVNAEFRVVADNV